MPDDDPVGEEDVNLRLGRHAIQLLQAARDAGEPTLIAQAEAMAMAVGFVLASRIQDGMPETD
ncbi:hypothetical protein [Methylobacterium sp. XJLW]|jgi:hypothetical protein|uniref:hypothetical protein n=1 Tax=Methylobacterium sp. XJLW TaxID=739141 RepID=UPI001F41CD31|nr:hypothetical protein [Methylobacterium sp. XJLW]